MWFFQIVRSHSLFNTGKGTKGLGEKKDHWNPLPEWVTEDPKKPTGAFDSQGRFSTSDQVLFQLMPSLIIQLLDKYFDFTTQFNSEL